MNGTSGGYVSLPAGIVSEVNDFTIATWVRLDEVKTWARVFDFGTENANSMYLTPEAGVVNGQSTIRFGIKTAGLQPMVTYDYDWTVGEWTHIAVTLSGNTAKMYVN